MSHCDYCPAVLQMQGGFFSSTEAIGTGTGRQSAQKLTETLVCDIVLPIPDHSYCECISAVLVIQGGFFGSTEAIMDRVSLSKLAEMAGITHAGIARRIGVSRQYVALQFMGRRRLQPATVGTVIGLLRERGQLLLQAADKAEEMLVV